MCHRVWPFLYAVPDTLSRGSWHKGTVHQCCEEGGWGSRAHDALRSCVEEGEVRLHGAEARSHSASQSVNSRRKGCLEGRPKRFTWFSHAAHSAHRWTPRCSCLHSTKEDTNQGAPELTRNRSSALGPSSLSASERLPSPPLAPMSSVWSISKQCEILGYCEGRGRGVFVEGCHRVFQEILFV